MRYSKCCVPGCSSLRQDVAMHKFPKCEKRLQQWLNSINCGDLCSLSMTELARLRVCHKHFERKFVPKKCRILATSYPSLFSNEEMSTGVPTLRNLHPQSIQSEHGHFSHIDHIYNMNKPKIFVSPLVSTPGEAECLSEGDVDRSDNVSTDKIIPQERIFSWQKDDAVVPCDKGLEYMEVVAENEPEKESPDIRPTEVSPVHVDVFCNTCQNEIVGFRYICVQCPDYDLCAACEARGLHHTHYVLRVPGPRPQSQVHEMLQTIRRVLRQNIEQLRVQTDGTVIDITDEEDPMVKEPPPPSPSLSHERSEYTQDNPNYPQDISDTFDDDSDAPSHTYDPLHLSHEKYKRITKSADPLRKLTPLGPILRVYLKKKGCNMELSNIANYNSKRTKQLKITDPNQLCENNTNVCRTDEETPAIECVPKDELDTIIDIQVIHSEPIDETASNETVPPLDKEFLKSLVLKIPEIVNVPKCEYTLHIVHMNCNYYIRVKKKICDASLRKKYCGDKIAYVSLTRLTQEEISAATDKQRRTCTYPFHLETKYCETENT